MHIGNSVVEGDGLTRGVFVPIGAQLEVESGAHVLPGRGSILLTNRGWTVRSTLLARNYTRASYQAYSAMDHRIIPQASDRDV